MSDPVASVVVPTHGRADFLREALSSVRAQSFTDWECLVVSDAPEEFAEKRALVTAFADPRIRFIEGRAAGANASRNRGQAHARGRIFFFLDDDDQWEPEKLQRHLEAHRSSGFVFSSVMQRFAGPYAHELPQRRPPAFSTAALRSFHWCPFSSSCVSVARSTIGTAQWDEDLASFQDWDFWMRLPLERDGVRHLNAYLTLFRVHPGPRTSTQLERRRESLTYLRTKYAGVVPAECFHAQERRIFLQEVQQRAFAGDRWSAFQWGLRNRTAGPAGISSLAVLLHALYPDPGSRWQVPLQRGVRTALRLH